VSHLWLKVYVARPFFEREQLDALQDLISHHLSNWFRGLSIGKEDRDAAAMKVEGKDLFQAIEEFAPPRFGLGDVVLSGSYEGVWLYAESSRSTLPPESNRLSIEIIDRQEVEGKQLTTWAHEFFRALPAALPVRYGLGHLADEFEAKNIERTSGSVRALGVRLSKSLPGLYWLNYFGPPYVRLIGEERLLTTPAPDVRRAGDGVFLALDTDPANWKLPTYHEKERDAIDHIGREFFFSREQPERETRAPDFRAESRSAATRP
jgi:hypothetical protein